MERTVSPSVVEAERLLLVKAGLQGRCRELCGSAPLNVASPVTPTRCPSQHRMRAGVPHAVSDARARPRPAPYRWTGSSVVCSTMCRSSGANTRTSSLTPPGPERSSGMVTCGRLHNVRVDRTVQGQSGTASPTSQSKTTENTDVSLEAPPGFEPGIEVLQTSALPLGDGADQTVAGS